ncbi:uncharacterized protein LOC143834486 [Paroedura picta]|uniref:uncharacterized protein LOC143834486 n=1 Tax=Paroedura picta TaxID=143630 RepID=UPI0040560062
MAARSLVKEFCEEVTCSVCLEFFKEPVILDCGHNFCQACLTQFWAQSDTDASCPQCRDVFPQKNLRPNRQLANLVELVRKLQQSENPPERAVASKSFQKLFNQFEQKFEKLESNFKSSPKRSKSATELLKFWNHKHEMGPKQRRTKPDSDDKQDISEILHGLSALTEEILRAKDDLTKEIATLRKEEAELMNNIADLEKRVADNTRGIEKVHIEATKAAKEMKETKERLEGRLEVLEVQGRSRNIRLRGISENFGQKDLEQEFKESIRKYLQIEEVRIENIFRVNSREATRRKQPRDILVCFDSMKIRDAVLHKNRDEPYTVQEQEVKVFQDLPADLLRKRADFHFLRQKLIQREIRYFWRVPFALEVLLPAGRRVIKTVEEAQKLADQLSKDQPMEKDEEPPRPSCTGESLPSPLPDRPSSGFSAQAPFPCFLFPAWAPAGRQRSEREFVMASGSLLEEFCEETTCSICLEYFQEPVTTECGHSFCQACLTQWGSDAGPSCPQCRKVFQQNKIKPNRQLVNLVELVKKLRVEKGVEGARGECPKHLEPLKLFCFTDQAPICVVCDRSMGHQGHRVLPMEEAFLDCQAQVKAERQKCTAAFEQIQKLLEDKKGFWLTRLDDLEGKIQKGQEENITCISEEISCLSHLISEMEVKCQELACEFLQDLKNPLNRCEIRQAGLSVGPEELLSTCSQKNSGVEEAGKIFAGSLTSALPQGKLNQHGDPDEEEVGLPVPPKWEHTFQGGMTSKEDYRAALRGEMEPVPPQRTDLRKLYEVHQEEHEDPSQFLGRLMNAFRAHTDIDPEKEANAGVVKAMFIVQSYADIRQKLQKWDGAAERPFLDLLAKAFKVYVKRERKKKREEHKMEEAQLKSQADLLAVALLLPSHKGGHRKCCSRRERGKVPH